MASSLNVLQSLLDDACGTAFSDTGAAAVRTYCGVNTFVVTPLCVLFLVSLPYLLATIRTFAREVSLGISRPAPSFGVSNCKREIRFLLLVRIRMVPTHSTWRDRCLLAPLMLLQSRVSLDGCVSVTPVWFWLRHTCRRLTCLLRPQTCCAIYLTLAPALALLAVSKAGPAIVADTATASDALRSLPQQNGSVAWTLLNGCAWLGFLWVVVTSHRARCPLPGIVNVWVVATFLAQVVQAALLFSTTTAGPASWTLVLLVAGGCHLVSCAFAAFSLGADACAGPDASGTKYGQLGGSRGSRRTRSPVERASLCARLLFTWMSPVMSTGYKKALDMEDLPVLAEEVRVMPAATTVPCDNHLLTPAHAPSLCL